MFFGADHVCDPHVAVIRDNREHEQRVTVRLDHDEVLDRRVLELDVTTNDVMHHRHALIRNAKSQRATRTRFEVALSTEPVVTGNRAVLRALFDLFV